MIPFPPWKVVCVALFAGMVAGQFVSWLTAATVGVAVLYLLLLKVP